jgi:peptidyl-prolyl cis-trans isomerase B (cyclophilin B)
MRSLRRPLAALAVLVAVSSLAACGDDTDSGTDAGSSSSSSDGASGDAETVSCDYAEDPAGASKEVDPPSADAPKEGDVAATMATSIGDLKLTLDSDATPCTVHSVVSLAEQGYFDDTTCHRLTTNPQFGVLQCGDPTATSTGGPGYTVPDELTGDETYPAGTLAMANTGQPNSGGSQFFICYVDTDLPPSYAVFGTIDEASVQLVADAAAAGVQGGGQDGAPVTPVDISSFTID